MFCKFKAINKSDINIIIRIDWKYKLLPCYISERYITIQTGSNTLYYYSVYFLSIQDISHIYTKLPIKWNQI